MSRNKKIVRRFLIPFGCAGLLFGVSLRAEEGTNAKKADPPKAQGTPLQANDQIQLVQNKEGDSVQPLVTGAPTAAVETGGVLGNLFGQLGGGPPAPGAAGSAAGTAPSQVAGSLPPSPGSPTDYIQGSESIGRATTDVGNLLGKSLSALGVEIQQRTPIISDPRVRGYQGGQIVSTADGGYFFPARADLDTIVSRIDSSLVDNVVVLKGPYTVRRGPGFSFIDITTLGTPRYDDGFEGHGSTSLTYKTNGEAFTGRQSLWGGGPDWGYRVGWDILTAGNYETGAGAQMPSSYNMQNFDFAMGFDFTENFGMEVKYFRTMQRDVLFPGALTDLNSLIMDAFNLRLVLKEGDSFQSTLDAWFNETSFDGDNLRLSKRQFLPFLNDLGANFRNPSGVVVPTGTGLSLNLVTNGDSNSWGFRHTTTLGRDKELQLTGGWDFRYTSQAINEFDTFFYQQVPGVPGEITFNFPIPRAHQIDPGLFLDTALPLGERLNLKAGTRVDFIQAGIQQPLTVPQPPPPFNTNVSNATDQSTLIMDLGPEVFNQQHFNLWSAYGTADFKLTEEVAVKAAYGFAQRPPTLTEMYGDGPFLSLLQNGGTFNLGGNPALHPEQLNQVDVGIKANYETFRTGLTGYYAFIHDYITFVKETNINELVQGIQGFRFINTPEATLAGFEMYGEYDLLPWLTPFATLSYVSGRDVTAHEPLPGIYPLDGRAGFRIHDPSQRPRWAVEFIARMVASQDQVATALLENTTPGFTVCNLRAYWFVRDNFVVTAGIENLGNVNYQEAFDVRFIDNAVYQPGRSFYTGFRWTY